LNRNHYQVSVSAGKPVKGLATAKCLSSHDSPSPCRIHQPNPHIGRDTGNPRVPRVTPLPVPENTVPIRFRVRVHRAMLRVHRNTAKVLRCTVTSHGSSGTPPCHCPKRERARFDDACRCVQGCGVHQRREGVRATTPGGGGHARTSETTGGGACDDNARQRGARGCVVSRRRGKGPKFR